MNKLNQSLLIAGYGYLGAELGRQASAAGWEIQGISKSGDELSQACDLSDPEAVRSLSARLDPPAAIALCASSGRGGPDAYRAVFLQGTQHLLDTFPASHLLFVSSTSVYGQTDGSLVTEASPTKPERETSRILLESEAIVLEHGGTVARLAGIYGPGRSVILKRFLEGRAVIEDDGTRYLNQIHRDDAAGALLHLATPAARRGDPDSAWSRGQIYNVADSHPLHQLDCYRALSEKFNRPLPPTGPRHLNRKRAWTHKQISNAKLCSTAWHPHYPSFLDAAQSIAPTL